MSEQAREAERRLICEHPPEDRVAILERQLAEAQGKLNAVQSAYDNFECRRFDAMMTVKEIARILKEE